MNEIAGIISLASDLSVVGLLAGMVIAFYQGKIIPRSVMEDVVREADNRTSKLVKEVLLAIRIEVRDGVRDGLDVIEKESK